MEFYLNNKKKLTRGKRREASQYHQNLNIRVAPRAAERLETYTAQKMKFSIKDFFIKCDQIRRKPWLYEIFAGNCGFGHIY